MESIGRRAFMSTTLRSGRPAGPSVPTCECGLTYVRGFPGDERSHALHHTEYARGPTINAIRRLQKLGQISNLVLYLVDASVPLDTRRKLAHVALVAQRSIRGPAGYSGTVTEDDQRLYILAAGLRAVAMVLTALDDSFWRLRWRADGTVELIDSEPSLRRGPKVARAWVAVEYRRNGLAKGLVLAAATHLSVDVSILGWELPFTKPGRHLARSISPREFWGCGDTGSLLEETLLPD